MSFKVGLANRSASFDSVLLVNGPNDFQQINDDANSNTLNSRLDLTLPTNGTYTITVNTVAAAATGTYRLSVTGSGGQTNAPAPARPTNQSASASTTLASSAITLGQTVRGTLSNQDAATSQGNRHDLYTFSGQAGQRVTVTLNSTAFDSLLQVTGPNGFAQANDNASAGTQNSRLELTLPASGQYVITAAARRSGATGAYQVALTGSPASPAPQAATRAPAFNAATECMPMPSGAAANTQGRRVGNGGPISFDEPVCGRLQQGDQVLGDGTFADIYTINLTADGSTYQAILGAEGFDPFIIVMAPDSDPASVETMPIASGRNLNTVITPKVSGTYTIAVNSAQTGSGRYRFRVVRTPD
jgi:Bacterial pre-peptidase C-terminal domain